jgi:xylulokinase
VKEDTYILAIDHGTSGLKPAIATVQGEILASESEKTPLHLLPHGGAEQDPKDWWNAFLKSTKRLLEKNIVPRAQIKAICDSGQWGCTVAVDKTGNPLMNVISWMDTRGQPYVKKAMKGFFNISGYSIFNVLKWVPKTGGAPALAGKDPIAHILYIKNEHPEIYQQTYKFLDAKDYINLRLTGKFAASYDSIHLHWVTNINDLANIHYEPELIEKLGLDIEKFPDLMKSTDILGTLEPKVAQELGLSPSTQVICGSGDLQMAAIGSGAVKDYEGHIYVGTSAFLICHVPFKKTDIFHNIASLPSANPEKYFVATEQDVAGAALTFIKDNIINRLLKEGEGIEYKDLDKIVANVPPGSNNLIFTPWLYGERTPIEDHTVRGGLHNISLKTTAEDMVRAVFEGVALNARWVLHYVEKFIGGRKMDPLTIIGGGAMSDVWCQIYADILNRSIRRLKNPIGGNARGAALVASVALGHINFDDITSFNQYSGVFQPNPNTRAIYDRLFAEFVNIYKANAPIYRRLNAH